MKRIFSSALVGSVLVFTAACTVPKVETQVSRLDSVSRVVLINAPDGVQLESGGAYAVRDDDDLVLRVADGWNTVRIIRGGQVVMEEKIFIQDGSRRVFDYENIR